MYHSEFSIMLIFFVSELMPTQLECVEPSHSFYFSLQQPRKNNLRKNTNSQVAQWKFLIDKSEIGPKNLYFYKLSTQFFQTNKFRKGSNCLSSQARQDLVFFLWAVICLFVGVLQGENENLFPLRCLLIMSYSFNCNMYGI